MFRKILYSFIVLIITVLILNISYATEVATSLDNTSTNEIETIDNTTYTQNPDEQIDEDVENYYEQAATTTTTDYETETELSISNIINIVLISVGIVLILLGIAIIIKLK